MDSKETSPKRYHLFSKEAALCHATAYALARNDGKNIASKKVDSSTATILEHSAQDSRIFTQNAPILNTPQARANLDSRNEAQNLKTPAQDSRICDEKSGLCEATQGRALGVRNRRVDEAIADLSRKAESTKQQLMPKLAKAS